MTTLPPADKRSIVEAITERITVGKGEIAITLCCLPPSKDMAKGWRKWWFLRPFCHLVIKGIRVDSHPFVRSKEALSNALIAYREQHNISRSTLAAKVGVGESTIKNWELKRTTLASKLLRKLKFLQAGIH